MSYRSLRKARSWQCRRRSLKAVGCRHHRQSAVPSSHVSGVGPVRQEGGRRHFGSWCSPRVFQWARGDTTPPARWRPAAAAPSTFWSKGRSAEREQGQFLGYKYFEGITVLLNYMIAWKVLSDRYLCFKNPSEHVHLKESYRTCIVDTYVERILQDMYCKYLCCKNPLGYVL